MIDVRVVTKAGVLVDVLPSRIRPVFQVETNETGKGQMQVRVDDPILTRTPGLLAYGNVVRATDRSFTFPWVIEKKSRVLVDDGERSSWVWEVSGRGAVVVLQDAIVYPEYGVRREAGPERLFTFVAADGEWYDATLWPVAVGIRQDASSVRHDEPDGWPQPAAQWLWHENPDGYATAGTAAWIRKVVTTTTRRKYTIFTSGSGSYEFWLDGQSRTHGSGSGSMEQITIVLEAGEHVFAARVEAGDTTTNGPNGAGFLLAAKETENEVPTWLTYTDGTWRCHVEGSVPEAGWNAGQILTEVLADAVARGVPGAQAITRTWTSTRDSAGTLWPSKVDRSFEVGTDLLDVLTQLAETSYDWRIDGNLNLFLYAAGGSGVEGAGQQPPMTQAAMFIRDRLTSGQMVYEDWSWYGNPQVVHDWNDELVTLFYLAVSGANTLNAAQSITWLNGYIAGHGAPPSATVDLDGVGKDYTTGTNPTVLRPLVDLLEASYDGDGSGIRTTILVHNDEALTETSDDPAAAVNGRREGYLQVARSHTDRTTNAVVAFALRERKQAAESVTVAVEPSAGNWPLRNWREGDYLLAPNDVGVLTRYRVRAITVGEDTDGRVTYVPELSTVMADSSQRFARWLKSVANGTLGGSVASASRMTSTGGRADVQGSGVSGQQRVRFEQDAFLADGARRTFTLAWRPADKAENVLVNGVRLRRAVHYGVIGTAITTVDPPPAGASVDVPYAWWASDQVQPVTNLIKEGLDAGSSGNVSGSMLRSSPDGTWWLLTETDNAVHSSGSVRMFRSPDLVNWQSLGTPQTYSGQDEFLNLLPPGYWGVAYMDAFIGNDGTVYAIVAGGSYYFSYQAYMWREVDLDWSIASPVLADGVQGVNTSHWVSAFDHPTAGGYRLWTALGYKLFTSLNGGAWTVAGVALDNPETDPTTTFLGSSSYGALYVQNAHCYTSTGVLIAHHQAHVLKLNRDTGASSLTHTSDGLPSSFNTPYHRVMAMLPKHQTPQTVYAVLRGFVGGTLISPGQIALYRSTNGGVTWTVVPGLTNNAKPSLGSGVTALDAYSIGSDDRLHIFGTKPDGSGNLVLYESSRPLDGSGSWSSARVAATHVGTGVPNVGNDWPMLMAIFTGKHASYTAGLDVAVGWNNGGATDMWRVTL